MDFTGIGKPDWRFVFEKVGQDAGPASRASFRAIARRTGQLKEAKDILGALPGDGESVHCIISGRFDFMLCIVAILEDQKARGPCKLTIATLSYNSRNVSELTALIDAGLVGELTFLVSSFFHKQTPEDYTLLQTELARRGPQHALMHARSHCKVTCAHWEDGSKLAIESSANLRTNSNLEFVTLFRDAALYDWHAGWIRKLVRSGRQEG
jgi:hypothetical protein